MLFVVLVVLAADLVVLAADLVVLLAADRVVVLLLVVEPDFAARLDLPLLPALAASAVSAASIETASTVSPSGTEALTLPCLM